VARAGQAFGQVARSLFGDIQEHHLGTLLHESIDELSADAGAAASDDNTFIGQVWVCCVNHFI